MSPLTQGLNYRSACDNTHLAFAYPAHHSKVTATYPTVTVLARNRSLFQLSFS